MKKKKIPEITIYGDIMSVSRLRMGTDGTGVTTLIVFYGCPLNCEYCINNECHGKDSHFNETPPRALYTPKELISILKKDEIYYLMSGGGIVFGGGEPPCFNQISSIKLVHWQILNGTSA